LFLRSVGDEADRCHLAAVGDDVEPVGERSAGQVVIELGRAQKSIFL
jgi:hypothetical protein